MPLGWLFRKKSHKKKQEPHESTANETSTFGHGFKADKDPQIAINDESTNQESQQQKEAPKTPPNPKEAQKIPSNPREAQKGLHKGTPNPRIGPTQLYLPLGFIFSCLIIFANWCLIQAWTVLFFTIRNDWMDIDESISGYVTAMSLPYSYLIVLLIMSINIYLSLLLWKHPIKKIVLSSWRPKPSKFLSRDALRALNDGEHAGGDAHNLLGVKYVKVRTSVNCLNSLINLFVILPGLSIAAPVSVFLFAPQFLQGPTRFLETFLPIIFVAAQIFYGLLSLPCLLIWSHLVRRLEKRRQSDHALLEEMEQVRKRRAQEGASKTATTLANRALIGVTSLFSKIKSMKRPVGFSVYTLRMFLLYLGILLFFVIGVFFATLPLWFDSAHFLPSDDLPEKPKLIGHRGLRLEYPENTMISFQSALDYPEIWAIETDISISTDGIPFCLHDPSLHRTTNVRSVYPDKVMKLAEDFTMEELEALDASSWFFQTTLSFWPFNSGGKSPIDEVQKIPRLDDLLSLLKKYPDKKLIFDFRSPRKGHPYYNKQWPLLKDLFDKHSIGDQIILLNVADSLRNDYPDSLSAVGIDYVDTSSKKKIKKASQGKVKGLNLEYFIKTSYIRDIKGEKKPSKSSAIDFKKIKGKNWRSFKDFVKEAIVSIKSPTDSTSTPAGKKEFWLCMYALTEKYLYSQAWCLGMDAVVANNVEDFRHMDRPFYAVKKSQLPHMMLLSLVSGCLFLLWIVVFTIFQLCSCLCGSICCLCSRRKKRQHTENI